MNRPNPMHLPERGQITGCPIPWEEIDENVRALVAEFNRFPGIETCGSCGGHENNSPHQNEAGHWTMIFKAEHSEEGWRSLEFIAWAFCDMHRGGFSNDRGFNSAPPYLNIPGDTMYFFVDGWFDPNKAAELLGELRENAYISVEDDYILDEEDEQEPEEDGVV